MQSIYGYPSDLSVVEPSALVVVDGVELEVESLSVSRELSSALPSQVSAVSGITAAQGKASWAVGEDVQERSAHPWDGNAFPPKPTDEVVAYAGYGGTMVRQLTGVVDESQGSIASGDVSSDLVDPIDRLNRRVSFPAILRVMPPINEVGSYRPIALEPTYITDRILRECGFNATPPRTNNCVMSAPCMGSVWPERGILTWSTREGGSQTPPEHSGTSWGVGLSSCDAHFTPELMFANNDGRLNRPVQLTAKSERANDQPGVAYLRAFWGSAYLSLNVTGFGRVDAIRHTGSSSTTVCSLSAEQVGDSKVFTLRVEPNGTFTLFADNGVSATGSASIPAAMTSNHMDQVRINVQHNNAPKLGGAQVNFGVTNVVRSKQTATLSPAAFSHSMQAFPRVEGRVALDLLKEQAEAECAAMWIDEHGHFRWVNRNALTGAEPVATLTALDDVLDIGWASSASGVRSRVEVTSRAASTSLTHHYNQLAWQGRGESLEAGQVSEEIATPPADTDWVGVDENLKLLPGGGPFSHFNRGRGTWSGGIETDDDGSRWAPIENSGFSVTLEKLADSVYKFTTNAGSPSPEHTVELRTPDEDASTAVWRSKRNFNLPVLRANAVVEWSDRETIGAHVGPPEAAVLEHDVGPWVQNVAELQNLADWLSAQVSEPKPILNDLSVIPDFRRQLGDVVWVEDQDNMRVRLKVLVTKITTSVSAGSADQAIAGRILEVQSYGATNGQLDAHAGNRTNAGFDTLWADATNAQLDNDPLGRG